MSSRWCSFCKEDLESILHLFLQCLYVMRFGVRFLIIISCHGPIILAVLRVTLNGALVDMARRGLFQCSSSRKFCCAQNAHILMESPWVS